MLPVGGVPQTGDEGAVDGAVGGAVQLDDVTAIPSMTTLAIPNRSITIDSPSYRCFSFSS